MATANPFDLLGDADNDDLSQLVAAQQQKIAPTEAKVQQALLQKPAKLPTKPLPPAQAVRAVKNEIGRGGGRGGGRGRGGGGFSKESFNSENSLSISGFSGGRSVSEEDTGKPSERRGGYGGPRPFRGAGHYGGFSNGEVEDEERPRRIHERRSGTGHGNEIKREGYGRGNWGTQNDGVAEVTENANEGERVLRYEKPSVEEDATDGIKEKAADEPEEKKPEDKEMTLEEYEKVLEEKRKALQALKTEERKVDVDKEFKSMQPLSSKKGSDDIFIKLGSDKDKRKELAEKAKKFEYH
ncbi:RGG repeats nuclear RNA binding protein A-like isoform X2 [Cornus florida]|uniref:RGG repeats nuclear RNA binding protein A-like isoform X2 n=1 Tax=Cornus florida TaxID=4283 RepID=UPI0028A2932A|nr:RGG repeats nuclear RNA binding protein A-like isoform X2 [Cornus florida]